MRPTMLRTICLCFILTAIILQSFHNNLLLGSMSPETAKQQANSPLSNLLILGWPLKMCTLLLLMVFRFNESALSHVKYRHKAIIQQLPLLPLLLLALNSKSIRKTTIRQCLEWGATTIKTSIWRTSTLCQINSTYLLWAVLHSHTRRMP